MAIPPFREDGWLPEGHWQATWDEVADTFGGAEGTKRSGIFAKLVAWRDALRDYGVHGSLVLDGSFISTKEAPGDCDCLFVYDDAYGRLDEREETRELTDYTTLKKQGLGDIFIFPKSLTKRYPELYQDDLFDFDKKTKQQKGVIEVEL